MDENKKEYQWNHEPANEVPQQAAPSQPAGSGAIETPQSNVTQSYGSQPVHPQGGQGMQPPFSPSQRPPVYGAGQQPFGMQRPPVQQAHYGSGQPFYTEKVKKRHDGVRLVAMALVGAVLGSVLGVGLMMGLSGGKSGGSGGPAVSYYALQGTDDAEKVTVGNDERVALTDQQIASKVGPAVVGISNNTTFFSQSVEQGSGSGIIINADGYVVTNNHVVEGATELKVVFSTGEEYPAKLIGTDSRTDLALLKIEGDGEFPFAVLGDSSDLATGESVIAIGNPLGTEFAGTVTKGVVSALNRTIEVENGITLNLIQTDAAINPGNSGGALVNCYGEVIGINSAKISASEVEGLGFAIPINEAKTVIEDLMEYGYVQGRPLVGIAGRQITEEMSKMYGFPEGVYVVEVSPFSGAERAGIKAGDVIIKVDGKDIHSVEEINEIRDEHKVGDQLEFVVNRNGETMTLTVELGEEKPAQQQ